MKRSPLKHKAPLRSKALLKTKALLKRGATQLKTKRDPLDTLFSEVIRRRAIIRAGGCERCGAPKFDMEKEGGGVFPAWQQLQCAHLISRWHKSTRWDEDAAIGLCGGCHLWIDHEAEELIELRRKILGDDKVSLLKARARTPAYQIDRAAIKIYLDAKLGELL